MDIEEFENALDNYCDEKASDKEKALVESYILHTFKNSSFPKLDRPLAVIGEEIWRKIKKSPSFNEQKM